MASFLKELSVAISLLTSDHNPLADFYGWKDYVWRIRTIEHCDPQGGSMCDIVSDRWDWKRDQRYSFAMATDEARNGLTVRLGLDNRDPEDRDNVCVVAFFMNAEDKEVAVFYQNWVAFPGKAYRRDTPITLAPGKPVGSIRKVAVGVKPCEEKNTTDAKLFYTIRLMLDQR